MTVRLLSLSLALTLAAVHANPADVAVCNNRKAHLLFPTSASPTLGNSLLLVWSPVRNADGYNVYYSVNGGQPVQVAPTVTDQEYVLAQVPAGHIDWYVVTVFDQGCPTTESAHEQFTVGVPACNAPARTAAAVVRTVTTGENYHVRWRPVLGATHYQLQESATSDFAAPSTFEVDGAQLLFSHQATANTPYYYRVRAIANCNGSAGPYSTVVRTVVMPKPPQTHTKPQLTSQAGAKRLITHQIFIPGRGKSGKAGSDDGDTFSITTDKPWLTVTPSSGTLPSTGTVVTVTTDPTQIDAGSHTGTVSISTPNNTTTTSSLPVNVSLVTPVNPQTKSGPAPSTLIIPAVSHANGIDSQWQTDIRLLNPSAGSQSYQLTFTPSGTDVSTAEVQTTTVEVDPGDTTAIDDIISKWYGFGALSDGVNGTLQITPIDDRGNPLVTQPRLTAIASSRTYDVTANGSLGQYIPAVPFAQFIGNSGRLSIQQVAQSDAFRTNLGFVEASGTPASLLISVFNNAGVALKSNVPLQLAPGEHLQLNAWLASQGLTLPDGRIEATVTSSTGKVTAYASVVDNVTNDPLLVSAVDPSTISANRYTIPGVADLNNGSLHWRTDARFFNSASTPLTGTLTFYPTANPTASKSVPLSFAPGEVKALDNVLESVFGMTNVGGSLQLTTAAASSVVATARTYQSANGTYGQFVPGVTPADGAGNGDPALQILQVEESDAFRTNVGIAEVSGNPATVEISAIVPDAKAAPVVRIDLHANEFQQLNSLMKSLGYPSAYNARVTVKVVGGTGRVTAYASVVDNLSADPTYVPAQ